MRFTLNVKILLLIVFILVIYFTLVVINIFSIITMGDLTGKLYAHPFTVTSNVLQADRSIVAIHRSMKDAALSENQSELELALEKVELYKGEVERNFEVINTQILGTQGRKLAGIAEKLFYDWEPIRAEVVDFILKGDKTSAARVTKARGAVHVENLANAMRDMESYAANKAGSFMAEASKVLSDTIWITIVLAVLTGAVNLTIGIIFARSISSPISKITGSLTSASIRIQTSVQQQAANTKQQSAAIRKITTTVEEIKQSGAQISDKSKQVAAIAETTSSAALLGLNAAEENNKTMSAIREQVELVAENIVALSEKTLAIAEIISNVNNIAEQSNLLAFNAAIEAVGAGENGRRFSIVANEIKNLADQAKLSTGQVRSILTDIQNGITTSVLLTEEAVKRVETGKTKAGTTADTIKKLSEAIQESITAFQQISGSTNQQQIGLEQVFLAMQEISQALVQTTAGIGQIEKAVVSLNTMSNRLQELIQK